MKQFTWPSVVCTKTKIKFFFAAVTYDEMAIGLDTEEMLVLIGDDLKGWQR